MEVLYIPQLDEVDASGETTATRYRLYVKTPEDGVVGLADKAVNKIAITDETALRLVVPPLVKGQVRDFFVRLVITADAAPEITFAAPKMRRRKRASVFGGKVAKRRRSRPQGPAARSSPSRTSTRTSSSARSASTSSPSPRTTRASSS